MSTRQTSHSACHMVVYLSDYFKNFYFVSINSSQELIFLFLHVLAMLGNVVAMLGNIVIALGGRMAIMHTFFVGFG